MEAAIDDVARKGMTAMLAFSLEMTTMTRYVSFYLIVSMAAVMRKAGHVTSGAEK